MRLRWTKAAAGDLEGITDYLFERTPVNAAQIVTNPLIILATD
jgi:plasmid stabilization system protein ParE